MRRVVVTLLRGYQLLISPLYGPVCKFHPSCSSYALEAVQVHGAGRGSWLGLKRLGRCHPWSLGGYDPVPGTVAAADWAAELAADGDEPISGARDTSPKSQRQSQSIEGVA